MVRFNLPERQPDRVPAFVRALPADGHGQLALFDADGTLWRDDVADDFTKWMISEGYARHGDLWPEYLRIYRDDHPAGCRYLLKIYAGLPIDEFHRLNLLWWEQYAHRRWIPEVVESVYWLADHNYRVWLVTGSPTETMRPLEVALPLDALVGMDFELHDGIITGELAGLSCTAEGKAHKVRSLAGDVPVAFSAGNGSLDAAMLAIAERAAWSVYPNADFLRVSEARGWHVLPRPDDFVEEAKLA